MYYRVDGDSNTNFDNLDDAIATGGKIEEIRYVIQDISPNGIVEEYQSSLEKAIQKAKAILGTLTPKGKKFHRIMVIEFNNAKRNSFTIFYDSQQSIEEKYTAKVRNLNARGQKYIHIPSGIVSRMCLDDGEEVEINIKRK